MSRISTPASIDAAPAAARASLQAVHKQFGLVPNLFRVVANSPAALEGYLGLNAALAKGALDAKTRERIALAVAEISDSAKPSCRVNLKCYWRSRGPDIAVAGRSC